MNYSWYLLKNSEADFILGARRSRCRDCHNGVCPRPDRWGSMLNATRKRNTLQSGSRVGVSSWKITTQKHVGRGRILAEGRPGPSDTPGGWQRMRNRIRYGGWGFWLNWLGRILAQTAQCREKPRSPNSQGIVEKRVQRMASLVKERLGQSHRQFTVRKSHRHSTWKIIWFRRITDFLPL